MGRKLERLPSSQAEEAAPAERPGEESESALLQGAVEVDENISARHDLHLREDVVRGEAVIGEDDVRSERSAKCRPSVGLGIVVGEGPLPAREAVAVGERRDAIQAEDPRFGLRERFGTDVGRINECPIEQPCLGERDGERVDFLAGAASRDPDLERRVGLQLRDDSLAKDEKKGGSRNMSLTWTVRNCKSVTRVVGSWRSRSWSAETVMQSNSSSAAAIRRFNDAIE